MRNPQEPCTPPPPDQLERVWLEEFIVAGHCSLCGNSARIPAGRFKTATGEVIKRTARPCICPNGRWLKRALEEAKGKS